MSTRIDYGIRFDGNSATGHSTLTFSDEELSDPMKIGQKFLADIAKFRPIKAKPAIQDIHEYLGDPAALDLGTATRVI